MVLGVLQTSRGIRFASLDVRPNKAVDIVRNSGASNKTAVSNKVLFVRPMADKTVTADSTVGKRMIAAYTANHIGGKLIINQTQKQSLVTRLRHSSAKAIFTLGAVASGAFLATKRLLPRKVYSLDEGRHFAWPALKLNRAQFSNMVATGIVAFGLASFALWAPAYHPSPIGGDQPITAINSDNGQRSNQQSDSSDQTTNSTAINDNNSTDATPAALQQTTGTVSPSLSTLPGSIALPVGGSGGGVTLPEPLPTVTVPEPTPVILVPEAPTPVPTDPIIPDVVNPVVNTVDNTVNNTVDTAEGLIGGL